MCTRGLGWSRCSRLRNCRFMGAHIYLSLASVRTHSLHKCMDINPDQKFTLLHIVAHSRIVDLMEWKQ